MATDPETGDDRAGRAQIQSDEHAAAVDHRRRRRRDHRPPRRRDLQLGRHLPLRLRHPGPGGPATLGPHVRDRDMRPGRTGAAAAAAQLGGETRAGNTWSGGSNGRPVPRGAPRFDQAARSTGARSAPPGGRPPGRRAACTSGHTTRRPTHGRAVRKCPPPAPRAPRPGRCRPSPQPCPRAARARGPRAPDSRTSAAAPSCRPGAAELAQSGRHCTPLGRGHVSDTHRTTRRRLARDCQSAPRMACV